VVIYANSKLKSQNAKLETRIRRGAKFVRFNEIALRESRETLFWLRVCRHTRPGDQHACAELLDEGDQIARIIARIIINTKANRLWSFPLLTLSF
jgi:four helix bundle protein